MCINSTARASFNHGYHTTVVASATATRPLKNPVAPDQTVPAQQLHDASLAMLSDMFAVVVPTGKDVPN
jgi:hypothetical protein